MNIKKQISLGINNKTSLHFYIWLLVISMHIDKDRNFLYFDASFIGMGLCDSCSLVISALTPSYMRKQFRHSKRSPFVIFLVLKQRNLETKEKGKTQKGRRVCRRKRKQLQHHKNQHTEK